MGVDEDGVVVDVERVADADALGGIRFAHSDDAQAPYGGDGLLHGDDEGVICEEW
jgi:hypothetical protein